MSRKEVENLLTVKSLITILFVICYIIMALRGDINIDSFNNMLSIIITFYFAKKYNEKEWFFMNSPYMGNFKVTQKYSDSHDGLDLVGKDSKEIHSTVNGVVEFAGWENPNNHSQGFGQYVKIIDNKTGYGFYFGHLSEICVKVGDKVKICDKIGLEGSTGYSTGSHCHYCIRKNGKGTDINVSEFSGIPNEEGGIFNDGYIGTESDSNSDYQYEYEIIVKIGGKVYKGKIIEDWISVL